MDDVEIRKQELEEREAKVSRRQSILAKDADEIQLGRVKNEELSKQLDEEKRKLLRVEEEGRCGSGNWNFPKKEEILKTKEIEFELKRQADVKEISDQRNVLEKAFQQVESQRVKLSKRLIWRSYSYQNKLKSWPPRHSRYLIKKQCYKRKRKRKVWLWIPCTILRHRNHN